MGLRRLFFCGVICAVLGAPSTAAAEAIIFSNLAVDGRMAAASRPTTPGVIGIEAADDFLLNRQTSITGISFIGLVADLAALDLANINLEIYRVFPLDSSDPPSGAVPTRANSPSDVALAERSFADFASLSVSLLSPSFTALNSVLNGINPKPNQTTQGEGSVTGEEVQFDVHLSSPLVLPAGHYFFVPQVPTTSDQFYWLSASRPIVPPGTPFLPDLQAWIRNDILDPNWLRVGTDIVGGNPAPTFNMAFELSGTVPEPGTIVLLGAGIVAVARRVRRRERA